MKRKLLSVFTSDAKPKAKPNRDKQQRQVLDVMIAGAIKLSQGEAENTPMRNFVGSQISKLLLLWSVSLMERHISIQKYRCTGLAGKTLSDCFYRCISSPKTSILIIRDALQDIMLQPKGKHSTSNEYFELFWNIKIKS